MEEIDNVQAYLILALREADKLYGTKLSPDLDNPAESIAELENAIQEALNKLDNV